MNLEIILSDTYYIKVHKLTSIECLNTNIWHRTLKYPAQDLSPSRLIEIYPHVTRHNSHLSLVSKFVIVGDPCVVVIAVLLFNIC
jgi:hypothetical protein